MSDRFTWRDVQNAAAHYRNALQREGYPVDMLGDLLVEPGSVTYGRAGTISWQAGYLHQVPGGQRLPRQAKAAYDDLIIRTRMVAELRVLEGR